MKKLILSIAAALLATASVAETGAAQIRIVATTPDLAAIATEIGGSAVSVVALAKPTEDPHSVDAKPSHIVTLNRADMLIEGGAELELGWLPPLIQSARNSKLAAGAPGRVSASQGVRMLEVPTSFDRSRGDVHALGNPHFLLDPLNAKLLAAQIAGKLARIDPSKAAIFQGNLARFNTTVDAKLADWQRQLAPFRGAKIVTYHNDFLYLAQRFGLEVAGTLEPRPGIAPSPSHLASLITMMKANNVRVILVQPFQNRRTAETVARQTSATVLGLSQQPGAVPNTTTYFTLMDNIVRSLAGALQAGR